MSIFNILQYPDNRLRRKASKVYDFKSNVLQNCIDCMFKTHYSQNNCAALASTQLDIINPFHIMVIDYSKKKNKPLCLINTCIQYIGNDTTNDNEGCMSISNFFSRIERNKHIIVRSYNRYGEKLKFYASNFFARCIQHELDHLNGILFIDHLSRLKRDRIFKKISKFKKNI